MTELENIRRTRRHADAGTRGDVETYGAMMSDDIVFHIPGGHRRTPATAAAGFAVVRDDLREGRRPTGGAGALRGNLHVCGPTVGGIAGLRNTRREWS